MSTTIIPNYHKTQRMIIKSKIKNFMLLLWHPRRLSQNLLLNEKVEMSLQKRNLASMEDSEYLEDFYSSSNKSNPIFENLPVIAGHERDIKEDW